MVTGDYDNYLIEDPKEDAVGKTTYETSPRITANNGVCLWCCCHPDNRLANFFEKIVAKAPTLNFVPFVRALEIRRSSGSNNKLHAFGLA